MTKIEKLFFMTSVFFLTGSLFYSYLFDLNYISLNTAIIFLSFPILFFFGRIIVESLILTFPRKVRINKIEYENLPNLNNFVWFFSFLSLIYFFLFISNNISDFNILTIPGQIAMRRYTDGLVMTPFMKFLRIFVTVNSFLGIFEYLRSKSFISKFSIFLIFFDGLASSGKAGPLQGAILCFFIYLLISNVSLKKHILIPLKRLVKYTILLFIFLFITQLSRLNNFSIDLAKYVIERLVGYAFGGINAFDFWYNNLKPLNSDLTYGSLTFSGIFDAFGIQVRTKGVFTEQVFFNDDLKTNIYTGIRFLISDFGYFGSMLFFLFLSVIYYYSLMKVRGNKLEWVFVAAFIQSYFMWIYFASLFAYNTYILAVIISFLIIYFKKINFRF